VYTQNIGSDLLFLKMGFEGSSKNNSSSVKEKLRERKTLFIILCLNLVFMLVEAIAGFFTGSLALISDAAHMFMDVFSIFLALLAIWFSLKPPTSRKTFGFYRAEVLAAFLNSLLLFVVSSGICIEAYKRFNNPTEVKSLEMIGVAFIGLCVNLVGFYLISGMNRENLNIRGAALHILSDALGSIGALLAGLVMLKTGWYYADPLISVVIAALILRGAWKLFSESVHILLEGTPRGVDIRSIEEAISSHKGVVNVHDLHAWTLTRGFEALSAHLVVEDINQGEKLTQEIKKRLYNEFNISHVTLQVETKRCELSSETCYETDSGAN
jgi:cobalt-zinc-cadmium efflux system protein